MRQFKRIMITVGWNDRSVGHCMRFWTWKGITFYKEFTFSYHHIYTHIKITIQSKRYGVGKDIDIEGHTVK